MIVSQTTRPLIEEETARLREKASTSLLSRMINRLVAGVMMMGCGGIILSVPVGVWVVFGNTGSVHWSYLAAAAGIGFVAGSLLLGPRKKLSLEELLSAEMIETELVFDRAWEIVPPEKAQRWLREVPWWLLISSDDAGEYRVFLALIEAHESEEETDPNCVVRGDLIAPGNGPPRYVSVSSLAIGHSAGPEVERVLYAENVPIKGSIAWSDLPIGTVTLFANDKPSLHQLVREYHNSPAWAELRTQLDAMSDSVDTMHTP